jgi:class 3 adenylate cyclase
VRRRADAPERLLTTVMFTDIVGSTRLASELGDRKWRELLSRQQSFVRKQLKHYGGREVDTAGDGFFATFDQPARAVACARAISNGLADLGIQIRAGIHMGEVEVTGRSVAGIAVHIGSRIMSVAGPEEVVVSSTVRDLMSGSDLKFEDRGLHELKGVPAQWRLFSVEPVSEQATDGSSIEERTFPAIRQEAGPQPLLTPSRVAVSAVVLSGLVLAGVLLWNAGRDDGLSPVKANTVARIDLVDDRVLGGIPVGTTPLGIASGAGGIWVTNFDDQTLQRIDPSTNAAAAARALVGSPADLAVGGGFIWVTSSLPDGTLYKIDPTQAHSMVPVPLGVGATGVAYGEGAVWVTNSQQDEVVRVDPTDVNEIETIRLDDGASPKGVTVGAGSVWVGESLKGDVARIDPSTRKVVASIPLLRGQPSELAFGEGFVWVTAMSNDSITRIDPNSNQGTTIDHVGNGPTGVVAADGRVWVANSLDGTIAGIDPSAAKAVERIELGSGLSPDGVAVSDGALWVTIHSP